MENVCDDDVESDGGYDDEEDGGDLKVHSLFWGNRCLKITTLKYIKTLLMSQKTIHIKPVNVVNDCAFNISQHLDLMWSVMACQSIVVVRERWAI